LILKFLGSSGSQSSSSSNGGGSDSASQSASNSQSSSSGGASDSSSASQSLAQSIKKRHRHRHRGNKCGKKVCNPNLNQFPRVFNKSGFARILVVRRPAPPCQKCASQPDRPAVQKQPAPSSPVAPKSATKKKCRA
jgi:hypothetical protein